tara:strand:- start:175 stop:894 length:720 start_codon:yes stop_codon:yes gene_type:complete
MAASTAKKSNNKSSGSNNKNVNEGKKYVEKKLGLKTTVPGPFDYMQDEKKTLAYNLEGKDRKFYGQEASQATDDYLIKTGQAQVGNYFKKVGGDFIRISRKEGEKLYAAGDPSISRSTITNTAGRIAKMGTGIQAMGSGNREGILSSTPISKEMLQSQNKFLGIATAALSLGVPGVGGTAMRGMAVKNLSDAAQPQPAYNEYMKKFEAKQTGKEFTSTRNIFGLLQGQHSKKTLKDTLG